MNPKGIIFSEFFKKKSKFNWEKFGETQISMVWDEELRPAILREIPEDNSGILTFRQWLKDSTTYENLSTLEKWLQEKATAKNISKALMDSRDLPNPPRYYREKEDCCKFCTNAVITGMGFIDTSDNKNKKTGVNVSIKEQITELEETKEILEDTIKYYEKKIISLAEEINDSKEEIEESKEEIKDAEEVIQEAEKDIKEYQEKIAIEKNNLLDVKRKIKLYQNKKPKIYRIKPLGDGRLYIQLENPPKEGTIDYFMPPFSNQVVGFPASFFEEAYLSPCGTELCWTINRDRKLKINVEDIIPYIE